MKEIARQSGLARFIHFAHFLATLTLFYTGLALFHPSFRFLADLIGGFGVTRPLHRVAAIIFIGIPLIAIIFNWSSFVNFLRRLFVPFDEDDKEWLRKFPAYLFNAKTKLPPQGKDKSGQRVASWFILGSALLIALTGIVMWANPYMPTWLVRWSYPLHDLSMIVLGVLLLGHAYLGAGIFQPYRGMGRVMFGDGKIAKEEARYHWPKWVDEIESKQ
jgi:formate dehydrogenase subunit gamma